MPVEGNADDARGTYVPDLCHERALDFVERHRDEPFFLMVGAQLPHHPQDAPEIDPIYRDDPALSEEDKLHCTQVSRLDRHVGELTAHLEELGLDSNTLVLVTSDNGPRRRAAPIPTRTTPTARCAATSGPCTRAASGRR